MNTFKFYIPFWFIYAVVALVAYHNHSEKTLWFFIGAATVTFIGYFVTFTGHFISEFTKWVRKDL